jgi:hypothetical protein
MSNTVVQRLHELFESCTASERKEFMEKVCTTRATLVCRIIQVSNKCTFIDCSKKGTKC